MHEVKKKTIKKTECMNYGYRRIRNAGQRHRKYSQNPIEENLPILRKEMPIQVQEAYRTQIDKTRK